MILISVKTQFIPQESFFIYCLAFLPIEVPGKREVAIRNQIDVHVQVQKTKMQERTD